MRPARSRPVARRRQDMVEIVYPIALRVMLPQKRSSFLENT
jgi:ABC-type amino acid transport system permease subunit